MSERVPGQTRSNVSAYVRDDVRRRSGRLAAFFVLCACGLGATAEGAMADYRAAVMADDPSSYFRMDDADTSTVMANEIVSAPNGSHIGDPVRGAEGALTNEVPNRAVTYFTDPDADRSLFPVTTYDEFSLEFFVWTAQLPPTTANQWYEGFGLVDGEVSGVTTDAGVAMIHDGLVGFGMGASDITIASQTPINDGSWHHVVATHDGLGGMKLYVDGALEAQENNGPSDARTNTQFSVGALQTNYGHAAAIIDEVAFYRTELSGARVAAHYTGSNASELRVYPSGGGRGDISGPGIDCIDIGVFQQGGGDCSEEYAPGTQVTLTPHPQEGSRFGFFDNPFAGIDGHRNICVKTQFCSFLAQSDEFNLISAVFHLKPMPLGRDIWDKQGTCGCTSIGDTSSTLKSGLAGTVNPGSPGDIHFGARPALMYGDELGGEGGVWAAKVQDTQTRFVGRDGSTLVNQFGSPKLLPGAATVPKTGGKLIGSDGASLIGSDGASLIGSDGGSKVAASPGPTRRGAEAKREATYKTYVLGRYSSKVADAGDVEVEFIFTDEGKQLVQSFAEMNLELKSRGLSPRSLPVMVVQAVQPEDGKRGGGSYQKVTIK